MQKSPIDIVYERQWSSLANLVFALRHLGKMGRLYGGFPKFRYLKGGIPKEIIRTFSLASLGNLAASKLNLSSRLRFEEAKWIGHWVGNQQDLARTIIANGTAHRFLFPKIKDSKRTLILERGSMYPAEFFLFPQYARREAGYSHTEKLPPEILDEIEKNKLADFVIAGSQMVRQSYIDHGFEESRVFDCSYGINTDDFSFIVRKPTANRPVRLGITGVIGFRKGLFRVLKIGDWAKRRGIDVELHFAGPIQDPEAHQMFAHTRAKFFLHGVLKDKQRRDFLSSCDLYLLPSYEEGLPFSVLEAMSSGLGAIVSNDTGAREPVQHGYSGLVLSHFDDDALDTELKPVLMNPDRILQMGKNARQRIEESYTLDDYCARIGAALKKIPSS